MTYQKIRECRTSLLALVAEIEQANDLALWQEADAKLTDALIVFRNKGKAVPPSTFTFSDGVTRNLTAMAMSHAQEQVADELAAFMDDEWPALVQRGQG